MAVLAALAAGLVLVGCGDDEEEPELTFEERLELLEGEPLTPAEVAERAEIGETMCRLDDALLDALWFQLDDEQLDFQDIVFATLCPERAVLYAGHTGRFVTEEAEQSGVVTSTTRPTTTTTTRPTTTRRIVPASPPTFSAATGILPTSQATPTTAPSAPSSSATTTSSTINP